MGEKQALAEAMGYFANVERRLDQMEYYQERRLRSLNLLDRDRDSVTHSKMQSREVGRAEPRSGRKRGVARRAR